MVSNSFEFNILKNTSSFLAKLLTSKIEIIIEPIVVLKPLKNLSKSRGRWDPNTIIKMGMKIICSRFLYFDITSNFMLFLNNKIEVKEPIIIPSKQFIHSFANKKSLWCSLKNFKWPMFFRNSVVKSKQIKKYI